MKKILGLDLGTASIGWALVNEAENDNETSNIIKLGVRVVPLSSDEITDFEKGRPLSLNADRTLKRSARRNLQRFKLRRKNLIEVLKKHHFITPDSLLTEVGKNTTHETLFLRAQSARQKVEKVVLARILLAINKKRGYKSSRKAKNEEEGNLIDGMAVAKELYEKQLTPGQFVYQLLSDGKKYIPDFYRSDLQLEFDKIWSFQQSFYPSILTNELYKELQEKNKTQTWAICQKPFNIEGIQHKGTAVGKRLDQYRWRNEALVKQLDLEYLAIVLQEINNNLNQSSGYLGAISDRSKSLFFNKETVGEYLYRQIKQNPHTRLKNQVFYRQDYLDEFEQIWETQAQFHSELTPELKEEIRDIIIFYQRKLKSQKGLISLCELEKREIEINVDNKIKKKEIGPRVIPKSSPLFQEFKIWQNINILVLKNSESDEEINCSELDEEIRNELFEELNLRGNLKISTIAKILKLNTPSKWKANFKEVQGNITNQALFNVFQQIADIEGYGSDWNKKTAKEIREELKAIFPEIGISPDLLDFNTHLTPKHFNQQASYQLWHLLYSAEDDHKITVEDQTVYGNTHVNLKKKLHKTFGFNPEYAQMLSNLTFQQNTYGNLSSKAIKKILPHLQAGNNYSEACYLAGYNHSHSLTKEEHSQRKLADKLDLLPKNSLRNPVVEKILNQMVNVVNEIINEYGTIDEVRIELARDLKKSAKERAQMTSNINKAKSIHDDIKKILQKEFQIKNPTRNDIIRYKLYLELSENGYRTLFTNQYISQEKLFSKEIDIEHIIPKSRLFDDSFSNKTLAFRDVNLDKGNATAFDFISTKHLKDLDAYKARVKNLHKKEKISSSKYRKLLMEEKNIPGDFIERDLRNSQYIAKKAKQLLETVIRTVNTTTGSVTNTLREDWDLINVMKELNLPKYRALELTYMQERKKGKKIEQIIDWNKRNDHRHHAMDALTVAFTTYNHVQYLNNLNTISKLAGSTVEHEKSPLKGIKDKITQIYELKNGKKKRKFISPIPDFREEAKKHIEAILISFKVKNKVVTQNINIIKKKGESPKKIQLTPRGSLHKETIYGKIRVPIITEEKINAAFNQEKINQVTKLAYRKALAKRLEFFDNNPKKAFTGKNSLSKTPIYLNDEETLVLPEKIKTKTFETQYTIRKPITPNLKIEKVIDQNIQKVLYQRLAQFDGDKKKAFSDLEKNPIWLNKNKNISIKRVTITGVNNAEALHDKKDHLGKLLHDQNGNPQPTDFVSTGNNHHVAIYKDEKGNLQEQIVSFFEAVTRVNNDLPVIDYHYNEAKGWSFLFTLKQNEMFVFPSENFNPSETNLLDEKNTSLISPNLYRVQKIATKDYTFRHHLETTVENKKELKNNAYKRIGLSGLQNCVKVRLNHLGKIVYVGESIITPKKSL